MSSVKKEKRPPQGWSPMKHKNQLKAIVITLALVLTSALFYVKAQPYTGEAKIRQQYEHTINKLELKEQEIESVKTKNAAEDAKQKEEIEKVRKQLEETKKLVKAKGEAQKAYAATAKVRVATKSDCAGWKKQAGIPDTHATNTLINNESGCKTWAVNPKSGACGIPQAYPCSKLKCPLNNTGAVCQLTWMKNYVADRYGSWDKALSFWYAQCPTKKGCWY